jgi:hypothetical protein
MNRIRHHLLPAALVVALGCGGGAKPAASPPSPSPSPSPSAGAGSAKGCRSLPWDDDQRGVGEATYQGKLEKTAGGRPKGTMEEFYALHLDQPVCLPAGNDEPQTDEVQVGAEGDAVEAKLRSLVGKTVVITGTGFAQETAHHHRPIVVMATAVSVK